MKRSFSILLITALLVALMPLMSTVALAEEYATITSENGYGVRLREGPSKAYNPLGTFDVGSTVVVLQRGDEWSQLQIGDTVGWMMNQYLIFGVSGSAGSTGAVANAYVYSADGLRVWLRATPGGTRLFLNATGTPVSVLEAGDDWCKVSINGTIGYMMTKYLYFEEVDPVDYQIESVNINYYYPVVGDTLVAEIEPASATVTYEWYVDGQLLGTEDTFEVLTRYANQTIKVKVTGTGDYYGSAIDTVYPVQINRGVKSVALSQSVPVVGEELGAVLQPTSASVDYSWRVGGVEVSSAATYTPIEDDIGKLIQLKVTGINGFSGSAACTADHVVISDKVVQYVELSNEYPIVGEVLTVEVYPSSADVNITWYADGEAVAYTSSYEVNKRDLGKKIKVIAEGVDPYSGTASAITANVASSEITGVFITEDSPLTGDWITALIQPSDATAYYYWYVGENTKIAEGASSSLELTDELVEKYDLVGKQIWVSAVGTGVYTGAVYSNLTDVVIDHKEITAVAIDNITPVVGDILTVSVEPESRDPFFENYLTYVWYADSEIKTEHASTYTVQYSDIGKRIRVKVIGADGYTGEAYSTYTSKVEEYGYLTEARIYNGSSGEYATAESPEVGHTLYASVSPTGANDYVTYTWYVDGSAVSADDETGYSLTVKPEWADKTITLKATGTDSYYFSDSVYATTKPVIYRRALNAALWIDAPEVGVIPSSSVYSYGEDYGYDDCIASIDWLDSNYETAVVDVYGGFLPGKDYIARVTVTPEDSDLTLFGANVEFYSDGDIVASTQYYDGSSTYYVYFGSTSVQSVTDYYIADLEAPVVGGTMDTFCSNDQVVGNVTWSYTEDEYTACIELQTYQGYTLEGVADNAFNVAGATKTIYEAGSNVIWAIFNVDHEFTIQSDKEVVYLDGYNRRIVQCSAHLSNYMGKLENVKWEIVDARVDGTSINNNGQLIIGMYEETGRTMTVRATVQVGSNEYVAEKEIYIYSGTDTDTALKVVFTKYNSEITRGGRGYFEAVVSNSSDGCTLFALYEDGTSKAITDGWLYIPTNMDDEYVIIKGISNEDHSVVCTMLVTLTGDITDPSTDVSAPKVEFTQSYAVVERGGSVTYQAESIGTLNDDCVIYVTWPNGTMEVLKNGALTIAEDETASSVTITAYSTDDPMLSVSMQAIIVDPGNITFTKGPDKVERGVSYTYEAIARYMATNVRCDLYADFGNGAVKLTDGLLNVAADETASTVTITAVCPEDTSVVSSKVVTIYPYREINFVKYENVVSRGGYAYTFTADATVFGIDYAADVYADFGDGETKLTDGKLVVAADETADSVTVTAKYTCDDGVTLSKSMVVSIKDKSYIEFVSAPTTVEHGDKATYKAVAYIDDEILDCDIFAIWDDGTMEKLDGGVLSIGETETEKHLVIKAVYDLGQPTEMSSTINVTIKPDAYIAFADGLTTEIKRTETAYYSANAVFKNTTVPAVIYADYGDGNGYVELAGGKLDGSKAAESTVSLMASYEGIASAYMTVEITDIPKIVFTKSASKVACGSTAQYAAEAIVDGVKSACELYIVNSDGTTTKLEDGMLTIAADETKTSLTILAYYAMDSETDLTSTMTVAIYPAATAKFTVLPEAAIRGGDPVTVKAEATVLGETKDCEIYADLGSGYALMENGSVKVPGVYSGDTLNVKAVYSENGSVAVETTATINIQDSAELAWVDTITAVEHGGTYTFEASATMLDSSVVPADIYVNGELAADGVYTVSETEIASSITVKAAFGIETIEKTVAVGPTPVIKFTNTPAKAYKGGDAVTFEAVAQFKTAAPAAKIMLGETELTDGKLSVPVDYAEDTITVTAVYEGVESASITIPVYVKPYIEFKTTHDEVRCGDSVIFAAVVYVDGTTVNANLTADGGTMTDGVLSVPAEFNRSSITVTASYEGAESITHDITVFPKPSIKFTQTTDTIAEGSYGTFKAVATVDDVEYDANLVATALSASPFRVVLPDSGVLNHSDFEVTSLWDVPVTVTATYTNEAEGITLEDTHRVTLTKKSSSGGLWPFSSGMEGPSASEADIMTMDLYGDEQPSAGDAGIMTMDLYSDEEPSAEEPASEESVAEEEPEPIVIVVDTDEPVVEEEPTAEEPVSEEPAAEEEPETIVIVVDTDEPVVEEETEEVETEPAVEEESAAEEQPSAEEPAAEEEPETIVIVVDTTEPADENESEAEETEEEQPAEQESVSEENEQPEEASAEEEDETLDALEGDDIGESAESESAIKISFTKRANKIKLGNYSTFEVTVSGSDQGVIWSLRLSEDVNGEPVSSIDQDGRLTVSLDELSEKLIVVATSREDRSVRARWIVEVTKGEDEEVIVEETTDETIATEETTTEEATTEESEELTDEEAMAQAAMAEENNVPEETVETEEFEEELITVEEGSSLLDMF